MPSSKTITKTPTIEATPDYSAGDVLGGVMVLEDVVAALGDSGTVVAACAHSAIDLSTNPLVVVLFSELPAASTLTENGALAIHADDMAKIVGVLNLSNKASIGTPDVLFADRPFVPFVAAASKNLYAVAVAGGTWNFGGTADLTFVFGIRRD